MPLNNRFGSVNEVSGAICITYGQSFMDWDNMNLVTAHKVSEWRVVCVRASLSVYLSVSRGMSCMSPLTVLSFVYSPISFLPSLLLNTESARHVACRAAGAPSQAASPTSDVRALDPQPVPDVPAQQ
jgi:hypothetical protein